MNTANLYNTQAYAQAALEHTSYRQLTQCKNSTSTYINPYGSGSAFGSTTSSSVPSSVPAYSGYGGSYNYGTGQSFSATAQVGDRRDLPTERTGRNSSEYSGSRSRQGGLDYSNYSNTYQGAALSSQYANNYYTSGGQPGNYGYGNNPISAGSYGLSTTLTHTPSLSGKSGTGPPTCS